MTHQPAQPAVKKSRTHQSAQPAVKKSRAEIEAEKRDRAARQAAKTAKDLEKLEPVGCRVLPLGDGKISTGEHIAGIGELHYEKGDTFTTRPAIAKALEARGFVEIQ